MPQIEHAGVQLRSRDDWHRYFRPFPEMPRHVHVHVCAAGSTWEREHLLFRDYLRSSPQARELYAFAKRRAAALGPTTALPTPMPRQAASSSFSRRPNGGPQMGAKPFRSPSCSGSIREPILIRVAPRANGLRHPSPGWTTCQGITAWEPLPVRCSLPLRDPAAGHRHRRPATVAVPGHRRPPSVAALGGSRGGDLFGGLVQRQGSRWSAPTARRAGG